MAAIKKYKRDHVAQTLTHDNRTAGEEVEHSNSYIDPDRTEQNYWFKRGGYEQFKARIEQVHCMKRDDIVVLDELIVTLPKDVKPEDERKFFQAVYDYACKTYGEENVINSVVHKDETRPHIHTKFIPVVNDKLRNGKPCEKVNHSKKCPRSYYQRYHIELSDFVKEQLGYEVEILNGATDNGNQTIQKLKAESERQRVQELSDQLEELRTARSEDVFEKAGAIKAIAEKVSGGKKLTPAEVESVNNLAATVGLVQAEFERLSAEAETAKAEAETAKKDAETHEKALSERQRQFDVKVQAEAQRLAQDAVRRSQSEVETVKRQSSTEIDKARQETAKARAEVEKVKRVCEWATGEPFEQTARRKAKEGQRDYPSLD